MDGSQSVEISRLINLQLTELRVNRQVERVARC